jgi:HNH endonuclease/AP2 domain
MKIIKLTQGQVALVDDEDYEKLSAFKWHAYFDPDIKSFYSKRNSLTVNGKRHSIIMHREIIHAVAGESVDHINHDTLDNRRENLRICSNVQNFSNRKMRSDNTSGFKGVSWEKKSRKWKAQLRVNKKIIYSGYFNTAIEAAEVYDREAISVCGEFALTNEMLGLIPENTEEQ